MRKLIFFCLLLLFINPALAYDRTFYEGNKTLVIQQSVTGKTLFTIQQVSILQGTNANGSYFEEVFNITSYLSVDYTFSISDIGFSWKQFKGNKNITNTSFFLFKPSSYSVLVNDYGINSTWRSKEVYNNQTGLNDTIWYWNNQTVVIGNHTEIRDNSTWLKLNNLNGKVIKPGKSYVVKIVFTKEWEKEFSIKTTPAFLGVSEDRMTWWNGSYYRTPLLVNNTGNASILTDFQVLVNVTYSTNMDANFTSFHLVNETSNTEMVGRFWIERNNSINGSYANMWLNLTTIPASVWDNTTYALYHRNVTEVDASNGTNTFDWFGDSLSKITFTDPTKWSISNNVITSNSNAASGGILSLARSNVIYEGRKLSPVVDTGDFGVELRETDFTSNNIALYFGRAASPSGAYDVWRGLANGWATSGGSYTDILPNVWYAFKFMTIGTNVYAYVDANASSATTLRISTTTAETGTQIGFRASNINNQQFDTLRVRKYASPEPTAQLGVMESPPPPSITSNTTYRTFEATWNQTVDVTWYFNGTSVQTNNSVTSAKFSNSTNITGLHNITASGVNPVGGLNASITWWWRIGIPEAGEAIREVISVIII